MVIPIREDFQEDEVVEAPLEESKKVMTSAHDLTLGKSSGALLASEGGGMESARGGVETDNEA